MLTDAIIDAMDGIRGAMSGYGEDTQRIEKALTLLDAIFLLYASPGGDPIFNDIRRELDGVDVARLRHLIQKRLAFCHDSIHPTSKGK